MNNEAHSRASAPYTPLQIANSFINVSNDRVKGKGRLTPLKLIKLTYIFYAWYFALKSRRPFAELPQAWRYGPVFPSVHAAFAHHKGEHIKEYYRDYDLSGKKLFGFSMDIPILSNEEEDKEARLLVIAIWNHYKDHSGRELSDITHEPDSAWAEIWNDGEGDRQNMDNDSVIKRRAIAAIKKIIAQQQSVQT